MKQTFRFRTRWWSELGRLTLFGAAATTFCFNFSAYASPLPRNLDLCSSALVPSFWPHTVPPTLLFDTEVATSFYAAASHQVLPDRRLLSTYVSRTATEPRTRAPFDVIFAPDGLATEANLRQIRRDLNVYGVLAVAVDSANVPQFTRNAVRAGLAPVSDRTLVTGEHVLTFERRPAATVRKAPPAFHYDGYFLSHDLHREFVSQLEAARNRHRALPGPFFRRDGFDLSTELMRRFHGEPTARDGVISFIDDKRNIGVTYRPELETVIVHSSAGEVPVGTRFIALSLHGAGTIDSNATSWSPNVGAFQRMGGALIAPDLPGATLASERQNLDEVVAFVHRIGLYYKNLTGLPVVVIGRSLGANIARELVQAHPGDYAAAFIGNFTNPYNLDYQEASLLEQDRTGQFQIYQPSFQMGLRIANEMHRRVVAQSTRYTSRRANGRPFVFYIQATEDEDAGPTGVTDLMDFMDKHDPDAGLLVFPCDHFIYNPGNRSVKAHSLPYMQRVISEIIGNK